MNEDLLNRTTLDDKLVAGLDRWKHTRIALWVTVVVACLFAVMTLFNGHWLYSGGFVACAAGLFYSLVKSRAPTSLADV